MAKQKKPIHRVQMTEGKRNIIYQLLEEYDIQTAAVMVLWKLRFYRIINQPSSRK